MASHSAETVDYSKPVPDCCKLEKYPTLGEDAEDDNMSSTSSHDSHESSSSDDVSDEEDSSDEEMDAEGNKIYREVDLEFSRFLVEMRLALNEYHDVDYTAVNYLKMFYKSLKPSNLQIYTVYYVRKWLISKQVTSLHHLQKYKKMH